MRARVNTYLSREPLKYPCGLLMGMRVYQFAELYWSTCIPRRVCAGMPTGYTSQGTNHMIWRLCVMHARQEITHVQGRATALSSRTG